MFLLLTQDRERCRGLKAPQGGRDTGEHSGADKPSTAIEWKVGLYGGRRYRQNERGHNGVSQRGWYRGLFVI